jgi:hypothetical protein
MTARCGALPHPVGKWASAMRRAASSACIGGMQRRDVRRVSRLVRAGLAGCGLTASKWDRGRPRACGRGSATWSWVVRCAPWPWGAPTAPWPPCACSSSDGFVYVLLQQLPLGLLACLCLAACDRHDAWQVQCGQAEASVLLLPASLSQARARSRGPCQRRRSGANAQTQRNSELWRARGTLI